MQKKIHKKQDYALRDFKSLNDATERAKMGGGSERGDKPQDMTTVCDVEGRRKEKRAPHQTKSIIDAL